MVFLDAAQRSRMHPLGEKVIPAIRTLYDSDYGVARALRQKLLSPPFDFFHESFSVTRSNRSRFITLFHTATKSCTNFSTESSHA